MSQNDHYNKVIARCQSNKKLLLFLLCQTIPLKLFPHEIIKSTYDLSHLSYLAWNILAEGAVCDAWQHGLYLQTVTSNKCEDRGKQQHCVGFMSSWVQYTVLRMQIYTLTKNEMN